jgi:hypothetical protein
MTAKELADAVIAAVKRATAPLDKRLQALESRAPEKGEKGDRGEDGEDGLRGPKGDSVTLAQVLGAIRPDVEAALKNIPAPSVQSVVDALQPSLEAVHAKWALDFERRAQESLQKAVDRLPAPQAGKDGRDGTDALQVSEFAVELVDGRTMVLTLGAGDQRKEARVHLPVVLDRGVFKDGEAYQQGDAVTWAGSLWIAQKDAPEGKPETSRDWRLAVKRGRDGKETVRAEPKPAGPVKV